MPGIRADWPEGSFYGYEALLDSRSIDYRGPDFGYWRIPDQFSIARFAAAAARRRRPADRSSWCFPPSPAIFHSDPVPPYQPDWSRLTAADTLRAAGAGPVARAAARIG